MWNKFIQTYKNANSDVQAYIDSDKIPTIARRLCGEGVSRVTYRETVIHISDYVLNTINLTELETFLGSTKEQAAVLSQELGVIERQTSQTQDLPKADSTVPEKLELRPEGVPVPKPKTNDDEAPKPLTRDDVLSALASRRTMAGDIESVKNSKDSEDV